MCGPGRGRASPSTICGRTVDGAGQEHQRTPSAENGHGVGAAGPGRGASEEPRPLPAHPCFGRFLGRTTDSAAPGESGGQRPEASSLAKGGGHRGRALERAESCPGLCGCRPALPLSGPLGKAPWPCSGVGRMGPVPGLPGGRQGPNVAGPLHVCFPFCTM